MLDSDYEFQMDLIDLIQWLGMPYNENDPIFPDTEKGTRMRTLWHLLFGVRERSPGEWVKCPTCEQWHVHNAK